MDKSIQYKDNLNNSGLKMLLLCEKQLKKSFEAFLEFDVDLAEEVLHIENRVNALDIKIEEETEKYLALYKPVAKDLRFVMAVGEINTELERIGDHAYSIAKSITLREKPINLDLMNKLNLNDMFETVTQMMEFVKTGYTEKNTKMARKVFKKDKILDALDHSSYAVIEKEILNQPELIADALILFTVVHKLERVGDLIKNIAEKIIFYLEAELIMHKKTK